MKLMLGNPNWFELEINRARFSVTVHRKSESNACKTGTTLLPMNLSLLLRACCRRRRGAVTAIHRIHPYYDLE